LTWDVGAGKRLGEMETVPSGPAKIADVAAFAGVGVATVSRVLNGRANVADATRERVLEAIKTLNYYPSSVARNLSLRRTLVIGVVTPFLTNPSPIERVRGIVTALGESEYDLALFDVESPARQRRAFRLLADPHRTDGLLIVSMVPPADEIARLQAAGIATVLVDGRAEGLPSVVIDDVEGGAMATRYLLELGHRRVAFIGDKPPDGFRHQSTGDRTMGYQRALAEFELPVRPEYLREGTHSRHVARSIAEELLRLPERPTAIFAASDTQALGVLEAARAMGLRVPDDLSVIGFDDIEIASYASLTTVRQPLFESGRRGAELLLAGLAGNPPAARVETLQLDLIVRGTTRPPA
jgi:DNA-binding LacI/PurR family transcriptional regulator